MNKKLMALVLTAAITFSSAMTAFAADTSNKISLDDRAKFTVTLQANSLVFGNEPTDRVYDSIILAISTRAGVEVRDIKYARGQGDGAILSLAGIADGSYHVKVGYVNKGFKNYPDGYAYTLEIKSGVASFKKSVYYASNLKWTANERTDDYALSFYKRIPPAAYVKQANLITAGITSDYEKVRAIHDWVASHLYYDYWTGSGKLSADSEDEVFPGAVTGKRGVCGAYAGVSADLMRGAGFPAKIVAGGVQRGAHGWTEVYVDNRWIFTDPTWDSNNVFDGTFSKQAKSKQIFFDMPMAEWSATHEVGIGLAAKDKIAWNGSLYIVEKDTYKLLKEVKNVTIGGLVSSTYGYKATDMYKDGRCTIRWNFDTDKVDGTTNTIYVKVTP